MILVLILFLQTFFICLLLGNTLVNFWFSYILFLIFVGGILILFTYIISLTISSKIFFKKKNWLIFAIRLVVMTFIFDYFNFEVQNYNHVFRNYNILNCWYKLFIFPLNILNIFTINFLFFILVISIKFTKNFFGPLRIKKK